MLYTSSTTKPKPQLWRVTKKLYLCSMNDKVPYVVTFTGHRTYSRHNDQLIQHWVEMLYMAGACRFRVGMAEGFDLAAASAVLVAKNKYSDIELEVFIPWRGFEQTFSESNRRLYSLIVERATQIHYLAEGYYHGVYQERNEKMVDGADYVIAWWNGKPSGTANTVRYARRVGCPVKNIYSDEQLELDI